MRWDTVVQWFGAARCGYLYSYHRQFETGTHQALSLLVWRCINSQPIKQASKGFQRSIDRSQKLSREKQQIDRSWEKVYKEARLQDCNGGSRGEFSLPPLLLEGSVKDFVWEQEAIAWVTAFVCRDLGKSTKGQTSTLIQPFGNYCISSHNQRNFVGTMR